MSDWIEESPLEDAPPPSLPAVVKLPDDIVARAELVEKCWEKLSVKQKVFLNALRDCHFNARAATRTLAGAVTRTSHITWMHTEDYAMVMRLWQANAAREALNPERLLIRQDEIVETALTPKPILYQGVPTGLYEVDASTAARANVELLDRAVPKNSEEKTRVVVTVVRLTGEQDPDE